MTGGGVGAPPAPPTPPARTGAPTPAGWRPPLAPLRRVARGRCGGSRRSRRGSGPWLSPPPRRRRCRQPSRRATAPQLATLAFAEPAPYAEVLPIRRSALHRRGRLRGTGGVPDSRSTAPWPVRRAGRGRGKIRYRCGHDRRQTRARRGVARCPTRALRRRRASGRLSRPRAGTQSNLPPGPRPQSRARMTTLLFTNSIWVEGEILLC